MLSAQKLSAAINRTSDMPIKCSVSESYDVKLSLIFEGSPVAQQLVSATNT